LLEPVFDRNSFGYRPGRSALDAVALVRRRSWENDWVVEFDIIGGRFRKTNYLEPSMSRRGNCWNNAVAQSFLTITPND
jgi:hypothetical protein